APTGTPMRKITLAKSPFALAEPEPFTLANLTTKSLVAASGLAMRWCGALVAHGKAACPPARGGTLVAGRARHLKSLARRWGPVCTEHNRGIAERAAIAVQLVGADGPVAHDGFDDDEALVVVADHQEIVIDHLQAGQGRYLPYAIR